MGINLIKMLHNYIRVAKCGAEKLKINKRSNSTLCLRDNPRVCACAPLIL